MLETKLGNAFANRTILVAVVFVALIIVGSVAGQVASMSLELASKGKTVEGQSQQIEQQNQQILQHLSSISAQKAKIEAKTAQLAHLDDEIASKDKEIAAISRQVDGLSTELYSQKAELDELLAQAGALQTELGLLQSKISSDEQYIADLTQQLKSTTQKSSGRLRISHYGIGVLYDKTVVFPIQVEIISPGAGMVSVDVRSVQFEAAFQSAVRTAANVASDYTSQSVSDKDIIVRLLNEDDTDGEPIKVDGPSAGAIITAMIIAGLTDKVLNDSVLVTGAIKSNGSIGEVGSIESKTDAAIGFGAHMLLVPESQKFKDDHVLVIGVSDVQHMMKYLTLSS